MPSFYIPLSGLNADSTALNTIANNLSNMNTTGFKAQTTNFSDLFYQQVGTTGSGDEIQQGTGVQVASNSTDFTVGSIASTGISTDAAINGTGFFVLDAGNGTQVYTRDGNFQTSATGALESTEGQGVMGYVATNGVINTASGLTDLTIPIGQVMQPQATSSFSLTQNLDSESPIGTQTSGQVQVYDSLGNNYEATVTYTNLGDNKWSYAITLPDTLAAAPATAAAATTMSVAPPTPTATLVTASTTEAVPATTVASPLTAGTPVTAATSSALAPAAAAATPVTDSALGAQAGTPSGTSIYNFVTSNGNVATVDPASTLTISGLDIASNPQTTALPTFTGAPETVADYAADLQTAVNAAGIVGVTVSSVGGQLTISGPAGTTTTSGTVGQDFSASESNYNFVTSNGNLATVDPATNLTITGPTADGTTATIAAPAIGANESVAAYAAALSGALTTAGIVGVTVTNNAGQLSIVGPSTITTAGGVSQAFSGSQTNYTFGTYTDPTTGLSTTAGVDGTSSLTITAPNTLGVATAVTITPSNPAGETAAQYATDIQNALAAQNISGVTVTGAGGVLSIAGPSSMTIAGYVNQDILGTTVASSITPTSPVTTTTTAALKAAALTPASTDTTTLAAAAPATTAATTALAPAAAAATPVTDSALGAQAGTPSGTSIYNFVTSNGNVATVDPASTLTISGLDIASNPQTTALPTFTGAPETVADYAADLQTAVNAAGIVGVTVSSVGGQLTISGPAGTTTTSGTVGQDFSASESNYNFVTSNGNLATVDPATNLTIIGPTADGTTATIAAPAIGANESVAAYAAALSGALTTAGIVGVTVTNNAGQLSITGPSTITTAGGVTQAFTATDLKYDFSATGTVNPATNLTITGPTVSGGTATLTAPAIASGEPVGTYAAALNTALANAGITGVTATNNAGVLSITGPTTISTSGSVQQDVALTTTNYNFVTSNGARATVDPSSTLAISEGGVGPVSVPAFSTSQSVAAYAANLQTALTNAGITDVTVTGNSGQLSITGPANMSMTGTVKQDFSGAQTNFDFGSYTDPNTGLTALATVAPTASLTITGPTTAGGSTSITVAPSNPAGESVAQYAVDVQNALAAANITGVNVSVANGVLSITGPDTVTLAGAMNQNMLGTTDNYTFETNATVDPTTNLTITGETGTGSTATIVAPTVSSGETLTQYAAALTSALSTAGIANVTVTSTSGQLSIAGANFSTTGNLKQGLADTAINYDFGSSATVNPATNLTIVGPTVSGVPPTAITVAPTVTAGETVAQYAAALNSALTAAGIDTSADGVTVTATGGQLSIVGPAATLKTAGTAMQDLTATTASYTFGSSGGVVATVDPSTNLTITGQTATGNTATIVSPTVTAGETLNQYATALTNALATAGIAGVSVTSTAAGQLSITGANLTTAGNVVQDPVGSANTTGTLTFDSSGNLVSPAANLSNITFSGLTDNSATMDMTWNLFGASGTGMISQTAAASGQSAQVQNGYTSGEYQSFAIGSNGIISATYSNGQSQNVGQLALATVNNYQGLADVGSTEYVTTAASGAATVGVAGTAGLGTLEGSSLEASNVNISAEFSDLIVAQRAFEANAKSVTTFDTITQETINMIH